MHSIANLQNRKYMPAGIEKPLSFFAFQWTRKFPPIVTSLTKVLIKQPRESNILIDTLCGTDIFGIEYLMVVRLLKGLGEFINVNLFNFIVVLSS